MRRPHLSAGEISAADGTRRLNRKSIPPKPRMRRQQFRHQSSQREARGKLKCVHNPMLSPHSRLDLNIDPVFCGFRRRTDSTRSYMLSPHSRLKRRLIGDSICGFHRLGRFHPQLHAVAAFAALEEIIRRFSSARGSKLVFQLFNTGHKRKIVVLIQGFTKSKTRKETTKFSG